MTEKWARQSHKAFPPCVAQRVQYADDRVQFCIIAALDRPDVSGCTGMTDKYLSKVADFATFKIHGKIKKTGTEHQTASAAKMLLWRIWFYPGSAVTCSGSQSAR